MAGHAMNHEASLPYAPTKRLLAPATEKSLGLHGRHEPVFGVAGRERQLDAERLKREERHGGTLALLGWRSMDEAMNPTVTRPSSTGSANPAKREHRLTE